MVRFRWATLYEIHAYIFIGSLVFVTVCAIDDEVAKEAEPTRALYNWITRPFQTIQGIFD